MKDESHLNRHDNHAGIEAEERAWFDMRDTALATLQDDFDEPDPEPEEALRWRLRAPAGTVPPASWTRGRARRSGPPARGRLIRPRARDRQMPRLGRRKSKSRPAGRATTKLKPGQDDSDGANAGSITGGAELDPKQLAYFLVPTEVAKVLRTTTKAVYARIERGLLPGVVRDGRRILVLRDELLKALEQRHATSPGGGR